MGETKTTCKGCNKLFDSTKAKFDDKIQGTICPYCGKVKRFIQCDYCRKIYYMDEGHSCVVYTPPIEDK